MAQTPKTLRSPKDLIGVTSRPAGEGVVAPTAWRGSLRETPRSRPSVGAEAAGLRARSDLRKFDRRGAGSDFRPKATRSL